MNAVACPFCGTMTRYLGPHGLCNPCEEDRKWKATEEPQHTEQYLAAMRPRRLSRAQIARSIRSFGDQCYGITRTGNPDCTRHPSFLCHFADMPNGEGNPLISYHAPLCGTHLKQEAADIHCYVLLREGPHPLPLVGSALKKAG